MAEHLRGLLAGYWLGTLLLVLAVAWWLLVRTVHRWLWRWQDRIDAWLRERGR